MDKITYRGRKLEEYTKEELIEVIEEMYQLYESRIAGLYKIIDLQGSSLSGKNRRL